MTQNFTLRRVALQNRDRREPLLYDLTFRSGRLSRMQPLPPGGSPQLYATPGFWDAHVHLLHLGRGRRRLDLSNTTSLEGALAALAERSRAGDDDGILWGVGWDENRWRELRPPVREEIDHWVSDRPVVMRRVCGHLAILNSRAVAVARERWPDLEDAGRVVEERAMELAQLWPESAEERCDALREVQQRALAMGITRVSEMGSSAAAETYLTLAERGELQLTVDLFIPPSGIADALELREAGRLAGPRLRLGGVKIFADGSIGARTAAFLEPYADRQSSGALLYADHALYEQLAQCRDAGLRVAIHAIGDAALRQVLRQLERLVAERGSLPPGWASLEHAELLTTEVLERAAGLGVRLSMQPNFVARWGQPGGLYERALGQERWRRMNPFRDVWDRVFSFAFGSDGMPMDPVLGLGGAAQHPVAEQRLTAEEALTVYLGGRQAPAGYWEVADWWRSGCAGTVLYRQDPLALAGGESAAAPIVGLLWEGEWVVEPATELQRIGVLHVD